MASRWTSEYPPAIANHPDADVWVPIWRLMHDKNRMFSAVIVGKPGSGKSWTAMSMAELLDRTYGSKSRFDISRATFGASEFSKVIGSKNKRGSFVIVDDAGVTVYSRDAMVKNVRDVTKIFQTVRFKNLGIILTLPSWSMLDKNVRRLVDVYIEMTEPGRFKFMWVKPSAYGQDVLRMYPLRKVEITHPDGHIVDKQIKVMRMELDRPSNSLVVAYEKKKSDFMDDLYKRYSKSMAPGMNKYKSAMEYVKNNIKDFMEPNKKGIMAVSSWKIFEHDQIPIDRPAASRIAELLNRKILPIKKMS